MEIVGGAEALGDDAGRGGWTSCSITSLPQHIASRRIGGDHGHGHRSLTGESLTETAGTATALIEHEQQHPYGAGSHAPLPDNSAPAGFTIEGNADSMLYHRPDSRSYAATIAEVWFDTPESVPKQPASAWPTPIRAEPRSTSQISTPTLIHEEHSTPMTVTDNTALKDGRVVSIAGPVIDVEFPPDALPEINTALSASR